VKSGLRSNNKMPVTKTAKRALRSSRRKSGNNKLSMSSLSIALHKARKNPSKENIKKAFSLADRASKKKIIHKNKASRIKSQISRLAKPSKKA
jgi:small subunit ribosomal protein S20